jgi:hypothetical protein
MKMPELSKKELEMIDGGSILLSNSDMWGKNEATVVAAVLGCAGDIARESFDYLADNTNGTLLL